MDSEENQINNQFNNNEMNILGNKIILEDYIKIYFVLCYHKSFFDIS